MLEQNSITTRASQINEGLVHQVTNLILVPVPAAAALFLNDLQNWWLFAGLSIGLAVLGKVSDVVAPAMRDYLLSFCFIAHCILLTSALTGHPWQIDSHMLYFAALAIVSTLSNPGALIFATFLVALHHISLSILMPTLVFPDGTNAENLQRAMLHAAVVLLETGVLLLSLFKRAAAELAVTVETQNARMQTQRAETAQNIADTRQKEAETVVQVLQDHLAALAKGDLECQITKALPPEYSQLSASFNATVERLSLTLAQITTTAAQIKVAGENMSASSHALSGRSVSQAATLEQAAAALEEMTTSVRQAAEGVQNARQTSQQVRQEAQDSGAIVKGAVEAMTALKESSGQISTIISVIDDIAFQTNLLALNAGVEAARAGEAGKGFAVVATEVRGLAHRSAEAAKEIKALIDKSASQVIKGVDLVGQAGSAIDGVVSRVHVISTAVEDIANSAKEQSLGLSEINTGVADLDRVTQQNAAMSADLTSEGQKLSTLASNLSNMMAAFQLSQHHAMHNRPAA
ncbi:methyl-accepting chemotaxis protein [Yoonia sp.]|uniref:methyl-accepting chemotaxis protein n=1 Tax=Yoonia sp. TaxID=2212373 RepID=UPI00358FF963